MTNKEKLIKKLNEYTGGCELTFSSPYNKSVSFLDHESKETNDGKIVCHVFDEAFEENKPELYETVWADSFDDAIRKLEVVFDFNLEDVDFFVD